MTRPGTTERMFGDVPAEIQGPVASLLEEEPHSPPPTHDIDHRRDRTAPRFTLGTLLRPNVGAVVVGVVLVALETVTVQAGPLLIQRAIDHGVVVRDRTTLLGYGVLYAVSAVLAALLLHARLRWTGRLGQRLVKGLRVRVFSHLQRLSHDYFTEERIGRILTRMTSDIEALTQLLQDGAINLIVQGLTLLLVAGILFSLNIQLALVVTAVVVPPMLALTLWFRARSDTAYGQMRERLSDVLADLQENLAGARVVRRFNRQVRNARRHVDVVEQHRQSHLEIARLHAAYAPSVEAVSALGQAAILLVGGLLLLDGRMQIGELTAFVLYLGAFFQPIQQLVNLYNQYQSGRAAIAKLDGVLSTPPSVADVPDAPSLPAAEGHVRLEGVRFGYDPNRSVINGIDLTIEPGETLALVGATGAGKSTLARLVMRAYDVTDGRVLVDGIDVRDVRLHSLRRQIGLVPQEPFLFSGTLRDNLIMGHPRATDPEILETCRLIGLDGLIDRLPDGLDTPISERGGRLSAGERQLVALGRALLPQPRIVILDEATSSLDVRSEIAVDHALDVLLAERTAIVIAHRLTTAERADRVAVVERGRIIEHGAHADLLAAGGRYAAMYATFANPNGHDAPAEPPSKG